MAALTRQSPEDWRVNRAIRLARNTKLSTLHMRLAGGRAAVAKPHLSAHYVCVGMTKGSRFFRCLIYRSEHLPALF